MTNIQGESYVLIVPKHKIKGLGTSMTNLRMTFHIRPAPSPPGKMQELIVTVQRNGNKVVMSFDWASLSKKTCQY
jgi:hypothetical protein